MNLHDTAHKTHLPLSGTPFFSSLFVPKSQKARQQALDRLHHV